MKERRAVPYIGNSDSLIRLNFDWAEHLPPAVRSLPTNLTRDLRKSHLEWLKDSLNFVKTLATQEK